MIQAAVGVLLRKGLAAATTRDVTDSIGVGAGLLNHYFRWTELRAIAFERIVRDDLARLLDASTSGPASAVLCQMADEALRLEPAPVGRLWIEAIEAANTDPELAERVHACTVLSQALIVQLLRSGNDAGEWSCGDPEGAAWRLLALLDGLISLSSLATTPILSRASACAHWRRAIAHECDGWPRPANEEEVKVG